MPASSQQKPPFRAGLKLCTYSIDFFARAFRSANDSSLASIAGGSVPAKRAVPSRAKSVAAWISFANAHIGWSGVTGRARY